MRLYILESSSFMAIPQMAASNCNSKTVDAIQFGRPNRLVKLKSDMDGPMFYVSIYPNSKAFFPLRPSLWHYFRSFTFDEQHKILNEVDTKNVREKRDTSKRTRESWRQTKWLAKIKMNSDTLLKHHLSFWESELIYRPDQTEKSKRCIITAKLARYVRECSYLSTEIPDQSFLADWGNSLSSSEELYTFFRFLCSTKRGLG